jgi:hypothetical protein
MNTTENLTSTGRPAITPQPINQIIKPIRFPSQPQEWKIVSLRECPMPENLQKCETPDEAAAYCYLVSIGTMDTILCHPREIFRLAVMASAAAIVVAHNHPSGEATPSEADIKITRDLIRAGQLLKIEVLDHIIVGHSTHTSLRTLGYFYS